MTETLERLKTEAERWIGAVAGDGSLAGQAAAEMRHLLNVAAAINVSAGPCDGELVAWMDEKQPFNLIDAATKKKWEENGWHQEILPRYNIPLYKKP